MEQTGKTVLLTGVAGFIGFHVAHRLLSQGVRVVGVDNLNDYYDPRLKLARLERLQPFEAFRFVRLDLAEKAPTAELFRETAPSVVVHLAAQAGVRYSIDHPDVYVQSNLVGFLNVLEGCRHIAVDHLVYASSSSVYGANETLPFSVHDNVDHPVSLYAATKKSNELMAHAYSHLYRLPVTGLRFFTVYGPWGRPDMAIFRFADALYSGRPIDVYNNGQMQRDFTYIDDITEAVARLIWQPAKGNPDWSGLAPDPATSAAPYRLYNIGNSSPVGLMRLIEVMEQASGRILEKRMLPMQMGDVRATAADVEALAQAVDFAPRTSIEDGIARFLAWYRDTYLPLSL